MWSSLNERETVYGPVKEKTVDEEKITGEHMTHICFSGAAERCTNIPLNSESLPLVCCHGSDGVLPERHAP